MDILQFECTDLKEGGYTGPKPPKGMSHVYKFDLYVLDC